MQTPGFKKISRNSTPRYIPLSYSLVFLFSRIKLVGWSALLFLATIFLTWLGMDLSLDFIDRFTTTFFAVPPETATIIGWTKYIGWTVLKWLYLFITRIAAFYLAFLLAFTITTPGYVLLAGAAEKLHTGGSPAFDDAFNLKGIFIDLWEGLKTASFGILITICAIAANFIPVIGQITAFLLYVYFSALMFLEYPASRRRWTLGRKLGWIHRHSGLCFRLGFFPALVSMLPIINIFLIALLFPVLTVHATLNFTRLELEQAQSETAPVRG